jgi:hypothetical protein
MRRCTRFSRSFGSPQPAANSGTLIRKRIVTEMSKRSSRGRFFSFSAPLGFRDSTLQTKDLN